MTRRENYLNLLNHQTIDRFPGPTDKWIVFTPGEHNVGGEVQENGNIIGKDWFGCTWTQLGNSPLTGATLTPNTEPLEDVAGCAAAVPTREQVLAFDWEGYAAEILNGFDRENKALECRSLVGFFERMHSLIGFENALCAFYEDPDAVEEFFAAMLEYKKTVAECVKKYINPDVMIFDDDYGTARATFMNPDMWRDFFPQYWKELVDHVHSLGMKFELHSCGYITPLVGDFVACGMDMLQPLQTNNDFAALKKDFGDKIIFKLAIFDKQFDALGQTEEEVRRDIRGYYETLAPGGNFLPDLVPIDDPYYRIQAEVQEEFEKEFFHLS